MKCLVLRLRAVARSVFTVAIPLINWLNSAGSARRRSIYRMYQERCVCRQTGEILSLEESRVDSSVANISFRNTALRVPFFNVGCLDQKIQVNFLVFRSKIDRLSFHDDNEPKIPLYSHEFQLLPARFVVTCSISLSFISYGEILARREIDGGALLLISLGTACTAVERIIIKSSYNRKLVSRISILDSHSHLVWIFRAPTFRIMNIWLERIETLPHE